MKVKLDLTQKGLAMAFRELELIMLRHLWDVPDTIPVSIVEATSRELTEVVDSNMSSPPGRIPERRSSVINAATRFVNLKIWDYREETGKGGHHKIYHAKMTEHELRKMIRDLVIEKLK